MKLFYLPLEPYVERYTYFMSSVGGWAEQVFTKKNINFERIDGEILGTRINTGSVVDAFGRNYYAMTQISEMIKKIQEGRVTDGDIIYTEDFWQCGIEALFYIRQLTGINFKIGCFLHAQSVDESDFTYQMKEWMRPIEQGYGRGYDYIFVTSEILRTLCIENGIASEDKIFNVGLPYNSNRLLEQLKDIGFHPQEKEDYVIFSSRFDDEKDPMFFLDLVERCKDIQFKLVKPRKVLTNNKQVQDRLNQVLKKQNNLEVIDTSNKLDYYIALSKAKVQFNCAIQDWVSWTLLEAVTFKCNPLYPIWKDFPIELRNDDRFLYKRKDLDDCEKHLRRLIKQDFDENLSYIVEKHDNSWNKYLEIMGV